VPERDTVVSGMEALTLAWRERGISPSSLQRRDDGTLSADDRDLDSIETDLDAGLEPNLARTLASGAVPIGEHSVTLGEDLALGEVLGRGGMGVVHVAEQPSLRREVAVKVAHDGGMRALLKEAWVGGHLEHPSVVPIHTLTHHESGAGVVMKRIEGTSWSELIEDPSKLPEDAKSDPLGWHLRVLMRVCDAIAFAHSRQVLHLDLKPDNVMIGSFGEVYVLDWGLAAGLPGAPSWLSPAAEIHGVAGTPEYMAPELVIGAGERIDERTDVYLLTAILHEVVTGRPPHQGDHVMARLYAAFASAPKRYADVPQAVVEILHRGMHADAGERFESVAALRDAVDVALKRREADALVDAAREEIDALEAVLASREDGRRREADVQRRFGAARFALVEAREAWAAHPEVAGLEEHLYERMADWAIEVGDLDRAESYLQLLGAASPSLRSRLDDLRADAAAREARLAELEALAREHDLSVGEHARKRVAVFLGVLFFAVNAAMGVVTREGLFDLGYREMGVTGVATLFGIIGMIVLLRRVILKNRVNRALVAICACDFVLVEAHWLVCWALGMPFASALALTPLYYLLAFGAMAVLLDGRFFWSPLIQVPTLLCAAAFPAWSFEIIGLGGGLSASLIGLVWRAPEEAS